MPGRGNRQVNQPFCRRLKIRTLCHLRSGKHFFSALRPFTESFLRRSAAKSNPPARLVSWLRRAGGYTNGSKTVLYSLSLCNKHQLRCSRRRI